MLDFLFQPVTGNGFQIGTYLLCAAGSLICGAMIAASLRYKTQYSKSFLLTLFLLPLAVQTVIMIVNGNLGTAVSVMGAFSLIRFRSAPGTAREILGVFLSVAVGLAASGGYLGLAAVFTILVCAVILIWTKIAERKTTGGLLELKMTVPETLNYPNAFDDLFESYTSETKLISAKTTNMGSLYRLHYQIRLKAPEQQKELIDSLRCRNGNLEIAVGLVTEDEIL